MNAGAQASVGDLCPAQQLVLLTLRSVDEQRMGRLAMCVPNALWSVFGPACVELALRGIEGVHGVMADHARRRAGLLRPVDGHIASVEWCLLELLCATEHGHCAYRDALCRWLVRPAGAAPLKCCAALIVKALRYRRLQLPSPACRNPFPSRPPGAPRVVASRTPPGRLAGLGIGGRNAPA